MNTSTLFFGIDDQGKRIDRILRSLFPKIPISHLYKMLRTGKARINGKKVPPTYRVQKGDSLSLPPDFSTLISLSTLPVIRPPAGLTILYEDADFLVVNKPKGIVTHGKKSLTSQVLNYLQGALPPSLSYVPGPLHRLDKNTTGIVVFGKSLQGARLFSAALQTREITKYYLSIVSGTVKSPVRWIHSLQRDPARRKTVQASNLIKGDSPLKESLTQIYPVAITHQIPGGATLVSIHLLTGRTHQIRAQAALEGHPLVGDSKYGGLDLKGGYLLHAYYLELPGRLSIFAPVPNSFANTIRKLFGNGPFSFQGFTLG
ncbi:MAG: RluA family pseudouridine synthase [Spirochaetales bacterium]